ncbi:MAG: EamA family transporter, partial [Opitutales bacterium]|nr:EamA family transporter [Opitutales bacterium]
MRWSECAHGLYLDFCGIGFEAVGWRLDRNALPAIGVWLIRVRSFIRRTYIFTLLGNTPALLTMIWLWIPTLLWAFSFGIIKHFLQGIDPVELAFVRLGLASLVFVPFLGRGRDWGIRLRYLLLGLVQFGLMYGCL